MKLSRLFFTTATLAIAAASRAPAQQRSAPNADVVDEATRTAVLAARDEIWRAWFANDTASLRRLLPRSSTAGGASGWETREEILAGAAGSKGAGRRLAGIRFDDTRIHRNGNVVVVLSTYTMDLEEGGRRNTVTGKASEVFVLADGVWQNPFWYLGER
jgi:hypothetical protein